MMKIASQAAKPERVLVYRLGSLGDTVVALPALHLVARTFPNAERRMLTSFPPNAKAPASSAILTGTNLVDGYFCVIAMEHAASGNCLLSGGGSSVGAQTYLST